MIRITFALLFLFAYKSEAQSKIMSCRVLEILSKEGGFRYEKGGNANSVYQSDTLGNVTERISKQKKALNRKEARTRTILIDTFGFFTPQCTGTYGGSNIEVRSTPLASNEQRRELKNVFWVSGIGTGKENAFCVAVVHQSSNDVLVYYLSILGNDIKLVKKKGGNF